MVVELRTVATFIAMVAVVVAIGICVGIVVVDSVVEEEVRPALQNARFTIELRGEYHKLGGVLVVSWYLTSSVMCIYS